MFLYMEPKTLKLVVKKQPITIFHVRQFIDKHMNKNTSFQPGRNKADGVIAPRYILKIMEKNGRGASTRVFFCKNHLIKELNE